MTPNSPPLASSDLARNLFHMKELETLLAATPSRRWVLLKGAALLACGCRRFDRPMQDVDVLLPQEDLGPAIHSLRRLGYVKRNNNPSQFMKGGTAFDVHTRLWYLTPGEETALRQRARPVAVGGQTAWAPHPEDHLVYLLAHAAVHHGEWEPKWGEDVAGVLAHHAGEVNSASLGRKLKALGLASPALWFLRGSGLDTVADAVFGPRPPSTRLPRVLAALGLLHKGHFQRVIFLRHWGFRLSYLRSVLFPGDAFLVLRYDLSSTRTILLWRWLRPWLLAFNAAAALAARALKTFTGARIL